MTISSGLCRLFVISGPPFPHINGGPTQGGRTTQREVVRQEPNGVDR